MTEEKILLTKEQDIWIKGMRLIKDDYAIIDEVLAGRASDEILELGIPRFTKALHSGYEVEKTQEERYEDVMGVYMDASDWDRSVIELTLDLLGIKIQGVND